MRYYKNVNADYLLAVGTGNGGEEITKSEYYTIMDIISSRPAPPKGYGYRLKADMSWELYELPKEETDESIESEMTEIEEKARAYDIIMGVSE